MKSTTPTPGISMQENSRKTAKVLLSASRMIGNEVFNRHEKIIGSVRELVLNSETGAPHYVVVSSGGFLGFGERLYAVPWDALSVDTENQWFMLNVEADNLRDAPAFDKDNWPEMTNFAWMGQVNAWYALHGQSNLGASPNV